MPSARSSTLFILCAAAVFLLAGCGLAESIAEGFVDDEDVVLDLRPDRSGTITRTTGGTDLLAQPAVYEAGDTATGAQSLCVLGFAIDSSLQPGNTEIDRVQLRIWLEPGAGDANVLTPVVVSHLPDQPDSLLAVGQVPHPPGDDLGQFDGTVSAGWLTLDVTQAFLQDWNGDRRLSAFAVRLATPTDGDAQADRVLLEGSDAEGNVLRAQLVLTFSLDL